MTDLVKLKDLAIPAPDAAARARAQAAAMAAFDAAAEDSATGPQGSVATIRPISAAPNKVRRLTMSTRAQYATAASVAALLIAVPVVMTLQGRPTGPKPEIEGKSKLEPLTKADLKVAGEKRSIAILVEPLQAAKSAEQPVDKRTRQEQVAAAPVVSGPAPDQPGMLVDLVGRAQLNEEAKNADGSNVLGGNPSSDANVVDVSPVGQNNVLIVAPDSVATPALPKENRDTFADITDNPVKQVAAEPVSTFSLDVDTASYAFVRRLLNQGQLPPKDAVRVEEMINYFPYDYTRPETKDVPFKPTAAVFQAPWNPAHQLVHIGIKGFEINQAIRPRANLVFLIDVSGSMTSDDKLPLVKQSFRMLVEQLHPDDSIGIVTYASDSGTALEPTKVTDKAKILAAIDQLGAGGSTAGAEGIQDAYRMAESRFDKAKVNRVILATDGDFNVGITDEQELKNFIERKRESGVFLSILGVGEGNYNDALMQTLAQNGNGVAAYVDTLNEARKVLVEEAAASLFPIATDVKIQVEFNPAQVSEYRLIGYETRILNREDFNNDRVDAGDIGSGHTVTAIYEVTPVGAVASADPLRYAKPADATLATSAPAKSTGSELGFLKLRFKLPGESVSKLIELPLKAPLETTSATGASAEARFATAVAAYGQTLRGSPQIGSYSYDDIIALAQSAKGSDPFGYRAEFINLVRLAKSARP